MRANIHFSSAICVLVYTILWLRGVGVGVGGGGCGGWIDSDGNPAFGRLCDFRILLAD